MITSGSNVNSQDHMGCTPSHTAAGNGHLRLVELLLDSGADIDMQNNDKKTPLDFAKENGKLDVASFLAKRSRYLLLKRNKYVGILSIAVTTLQYITISMITIFSMYIVHVH